MDLSITYEALYSGLKNVLSIKPVDEVLVSQWAKETYKMHEFYFKQRKFYLVKELQMMGLRNILINYDIDLSNYELSKVLNKFWQYFTKNCELYDDVPPTLSQLVKNGYELGVITNADEENVTQILKKCNMDEIFKVIVISSEFKRYKPDIFLFEKALELAKYSPQEAVYVGDSITDIYGAKKLGITTILLARNKVLENINSIPDIEPDFRIDDLTELPKIFG